MKAQTPTLEPSSSASVSHLHQHDVPQVRRKSSMVKVEAFDIVFDNPDGVFYAGQDVSGTILVQLKEEKKVNEILLELKAKAKTYWTKHSGKSRQHYTDSEPYFCEQFNTEYTHAYGTPQERVLPAGRHEIPFAYSLPSNLPSSFEGDFGHVRYTATATLERPWDFDIICSRVFSVVGIETEDLNEHKAARDSVIIEDAEFDVTTCWRKVGSIRVSVNLAKAGYVPGETIFINAKICNDSNRPLKYTTARMKQHVCYRAKSFMGTFEDKQISTTVSKCEKGLVAPHSTQKWTNEPMEVPPVPPKLLKCKPIDINYSLEFEVDTGFQVIAPLFIGTVPLVDIHMHEEHTARSVEETKDKLEVQEGTSPKRSISPVIQKYPMLPDPTFEENYFGKFDTRESRHGEQAHGTSKFAPKYPCYRTLSKVPPTMFVAMKSKSESTNSGVDPVEGVSSQQALINPEGTTEKTTTGADGACSTVEIVIEEASVCDGN